MAVEDGKLFVGEIEKLEALTLVEEDEIEDDDNLKDLE